MCIRKTLYERVGGFDLNFSPYGLHDLDFQLRCQVIKGAGFFKEAQNSILYHFCGQAKSTLPTEYTWKIIGESKSIYFQEKWGMTVQEASTKRLLVAGVDPSVV